MDTETLRKNLFFWIIEDYLESKNAGSAGIGRWTERVRKSIENLLESSGAERGSGLKGFSRFCGQSDVLPGKSEAQIVTSEKMLYWVKDLIDESLAKNIVEDDYDELTTHGIIKAKADFFCPGFTVALVNSQFEGQERSQWVIEK